MIGVGTIPPGVPNPKLLIACIVLYSYPSAADKVLVKNNWCHGSTWHGYAFSMVNCDQKETNPFANNTVGSAFVGYILNTNGAGCQLFSYAKAFGCGVGQISGSPGISKLILDQFIILDSKKALSPRFGGAGNTDNTAIVQNSYISAVSRPSCAYCYLTGAFSCSNMRGTKLLTATANG